LTSSASLKLEIAKLEEVYYMAYEKDKDVVVKEYEISDGRGGQLYIKVMCYNGGQNKLQIGGRSYVDDEGKVQWKKLGRLNRDEVLQLKDLLDQWCEEYFD